MIRIIGITIALLVWANFALGQEGGTLRGKVTETETGEPTPFINVILKSSQTQKGTETNKQGKYEFKNIPAGSYEVSFISVQHETKVLKDVTIDNGEVTEKNVQLKSSSVELQESLYYNQDRAAPLISHHESFSGYRRTSNTTFNRESYDHITDNKFRNVQERPLSTFSIDVDNAAYANARRFINQDQLPPKDAIRIEEFINYFNYDYPQPEEDHPFSINTELGSCPWNTDHQLLHIGLQGKKIPKENLPPSNLVFLIDVSGSMNRPNKLPLLKKSLKLLVNELREEDRITIVVYAGDAGMKLPPTAGNEKEKIVRAIEELNASGSTAGSRGIKLAYEKAEEYFIEGGNNRVILATDGDFNVGVTSEGALVRLIEEKREMNIFLSVLGFGSGNYQDSKMEKLSNKGNGNYAYIDNILEAKKTLVNEFGSTLHTIAKDVKIQIEFNPVHTEAYRLIGYVNRQLDKEDFADDSVDAGEMGAGHSVTALYEIVPKDEKPKPAPGDIDELKYQEKSIKETAYETEELGVVKFRYKEPEGTESQLIEHPISSESTGELSTNFHWSSAVAMFGMELRDSEYKGNTNIPLIREVAKKGTNEAIDSYGYRAEFMKLLEKVQTLREVD